jgi:hypothetical protein
VGDQQPAAAPMREDDRLRGTHPRGPEVGDSLRQPDVSLSADPLYRLVVTLNQS